VAAGLGTPPAPDPFAEASGCLPNGDQPAPALPARAVLTIVPVS